MWPTPGSSTSSHGSPASAARRHSAGRSRRARRRRRRRARAAAARPAGAARSARRGRSAADTCPAGRRAAALAAPRESPSRAPRGGPRRPPGRPPRRAGCSARRRAPRPGRPRRAAAQSASCPPAECPMATTRLVSSGSSSLPEVVDAGGHVLERLRPAAPAAPAEPAVLEVPHRPAAPGEVGHERVLEPQVVAGTPEATMDQDGHRPRSGARRGPRELAELVPPLAVGMPPRLDAGEYREPPTMVPLPGA